MIAYLLGSWCAYPSAPAPHREQFLKDCAGVCLYTHHLALARGVEESRVYGQPDYQGVGVLGRIHKNLSLNQTEAMQSFCLFCFVLNFLPNTRSKFHLLTSNICCLLYPSPCTPCKYCGRHRVPTGPGLRPALPCLGNVAARFWEVPTFALLVRVVLTFRDVFPKLITESMQPVEGPSTWVTATWKVGKHSGCCPYL